MVLPIRPSMIAHRLPILSIVGPTAIGKTDVAIQISRRAPAEIISADSMAVYRGLNIGTAKPTDSQRRLARFHCIDIAEPNERFSVAEFQRCAHAAIDGCTGRGHLPILSGGTGLYVRAVLDGLSLACVPADERFRTALREEADILGSQRLHDRLQCVDPATAERVHPNDLVRIIRALEVWHATGRPLSLYIDRDRAERQPATAIRIGLRMSMDALDLRIVERVHRMYSMGLVREVEGLLARGLSPDAPAMRALGYAETVAYLLRDSTHDECVEKVIKNTRRYARRQMTWFRSDKALHWLDIDQRDAEETADTILDLYRANLERSDTV